MMPPALHQRQAKNPSVLLLHHISTQVLLPLSLVLISTHLACLQQGNGAIASVLHHRIAHSMRMLHGGAGRPCCQRAGDNVSVLLRQHHGGLPIRAPLRVRPRGVTWPALLHQPCADVTPPFRLLPRPQHRLRLSGPHSARSGHVRLPRARPLPERARQWIRSWAMASHISGSWSRQRVPPSGLPRQLTTLPGLPRPAALDMPEQRVWYGVWGLLWLPGLGRLRSEAIWISIWVGCATRMLCDAMGCHPGSEREPAPVWGVQQRIQPGTCADVGGGPWMDIWYPGGMAAAGGQPGVLWCVPCHGRGVWSWQGQSRWPVPMRGLELNLQLWLLHRRSNVKRGGHYRRAFLCRSCLR